METLHRILHPETRIVDADKGILDYNSTDPTPDSYNEIVIPGGMDGSNFAKNAPFVDSHDYSTYANCVGTVLDFHLEGNTLVERVQWAIGIGHELADLGWNLTKAGFLRAVSIGFFPVETLTPTSGKPFTDALKELGLPAETEVRCIYTKWKQVELSACILGANPNALARARSEGLILDKHLERFPALERRLEKARATAFSFPSRSTAPTHSTTSIHSTEDFMSKLNILTGRSGVPTPQKAYDRLEVVRRAGTEDEIACAFAQARVATVMEQRNAGLDPIEQHLRQPGRREFWMAIARLLQRRSDAASLVKPNEIEALRDMGLIRRDLDASPGGAGASFFLGQAMSQDIFDLLLTYGAFRTLGLRIMEKQFTKYAKITGRPSAVFIPPTTQVATPIPADVSAGGTQLLPEANYVAALLNISLGLLEDAAVDWSRLMVETFTQSLGARIDYACFSGNGAVDANNGGQTGIFVDTNIKTFAAANGNTTVEQLDRTDFLAVVGTVAPAALQRPCAWWINPAFLPVLARIAEGPTSAHYLLRTPAETGDGTWRIVGFPVVWTAQAPATDGANQKFAAFGHGDSYLVGMREEFELMASEHSQFNTLQSQYRAASRVFCETREATGLATLTTAPN